MHTGVIEAVPAASLRALAVSLEIAGTVVGGDVVLARDVKDATRLQALQDFARRIEFFRLRELRDVPRVQDEGGTLRQRVHLGHRLGQRRRHVLVCFLIEADVAIAHLNEEDALALGLREKWQSAHCK